MEYPQATHLNFQLSTFNSQLSTFNSQLSTFNFQLSTFNSQLSTLNSQLSTFNSQLSTLNFQLSTLNFQLSTLNSQLSTFNFQLSTFNSDNYKLPMLIDTHSHLYTAAFDADRNEAVARAIEAGVRAIILPGIDQANHSALMQTATAYPNLCLPAIGLHPTSVDANFKQELDFIKQQLDATHLATPKATHFAAFGEIGIDGYWSKEFMAQQREAFECQLEWASEAHLPVIIHSRNSFDDLFEILYRRRDLHTKGVFHAFSGSYEQFKQLQKCGDFTIGIGGVVTYKNAGLAGTVSKIGLSSLLLETDSPWLTPTPHRGKRNESSYLIFIVQKLSELLHKPMEEVAATTTQNACTLFPQCQHLLSSPVSKRN